jgi:low affinity Fe/Cu permease
MISKTNITSYHKIFGTFSEKAASRTGAPLAFILALSFVIICAAAGPFFHYSSAWEMTATIVPTTITFLLVFLIQNSQNRETLAVQLKLNELIRATEGAHTTMVNLEKLTQEELVVLCGQYELLAEGARRRLKKGQTDQGVHEIPIADAS